MAFLTDSGCLQSWVWRLRRKDRGAASVEEKETHSGLISRSVCHMQKQEGGKSSVGLAIHWLEPCPGCHTAGWSITPLVEFTMVGRDGHGLGEGRKKCLFFLSSDTAFHSIGTTPPEVLAVYDAFSWNIHSQERCQHHAKITWALRF